MRLSWLLLIAAVAHCHVQTLDSSGTTDRPAGAYLPIWVPQLAKCPSDAPFMDATCLAQCPPGKGVNETNHCNKCVGDTPYANHTSHQCVTECATGHAPNVNRDCKKCDGPAPYTDLWAQECLTECRPGMEINEINSGNQTNECQECEAGRYADHLNNRCGVDCPEGTAENINTWNCDKDTMLGSSGTCDEEEPFLDVTTCVGKCPAGQVPKDKDGSTDADLTCTDCAADEFADHMAHVCVASCPSFSVLQDCVPACPASSKFIDNAKCVATCPEGQAPSDKSGAAVDDRTCTACDAGKFADHNNNRCVDDCPSDSSADSDTKECIEAEEHVVLAHVQ